MTKVAVVGAGISGLAAALRLTPHAEVTLYEAANYLGGHSNTVEVSLDGCRYPVDTGFLVFNHRTYPGLVRLFEELSVPTAASDMSFSVSIGPHQFEWCGTNLAALFAQPSNALSPRFWRMLRDLFRFNRQASEMARQFEAQPQSATLNQPIGEFLANQRYSDAFKDLYLLPMAAAIWSCPMKTMLNFPLGSFVRFFHNHGLLQIENRPQWFTVKGGSREYVQRIEQRLQQVRLSTPVRWVRRMAGEQPSAGVMLTTDSGTEHFDHVVLACHSDQALRLLPEANPLERELLSSIRYQPNQAWLHTDTSLMPRRRRAWAAWNYLSDGHLDSPMVSVTYWLNRLQPLPFRSPVMVSLNPLREPATEHQIGHFRYDHPVFDGPAIAAQRRLQQAQGHGGVWFAGAWAGYGFHEDGLRSGLEAASQLLAVAGLGPYSKSDSQQAA